MGRSREKTPFGTEEVKVEIFEGSLGKFRERDEELPIFGTRSDSAGQLDVNIEAVGDQENSVAVFGLGFADVDVAGKGAGKGRAGDGEGADL